MKPEDLKQWRREHGYSQQALADTLGVPKVTVYRWESSGKAVRRIPPFLHITLECIANKKGGSKSTAKGKHKGQSDNKGDKKIDKKEVK
jgi:DNA-binding XRE family transcriptional regulator